MVVGDGDDLLTLTAGPLSLVLCPKIGGSIARFDHVEDGNRFAILRPTAGSPPDVLGAASFPLVPYVNRIRSGEFHFRGQIVRIAPNMPGDPSPLHGQGWLAAWEVLEAGESDARLRFEHRAGEWPWQYAAEQQFRLSEDGLELTLSCTNHSATPMPCGLGQHPYFQCGPNTRIATEVEHVWLIDEHVLPTEKAKAEGRFDLADRPVCGLGLDHGFDGWGGRTTLSDPAWPKRVTMSSPDAHFFQLYSPPEGQIFVAEPVTHANAALNAPESEWGDLGMKVLGPGESMAMTMGLNLS